MICIICREDKENMSIEHVIPDSMGGFYYLKNICKTCNSKMGEEVDSPLVNHKLTELYRFSQKIEGKRGTIPNPFSGILFEKEDPTVKARLDVNKTGNLDLNYHPLIKLNEANGYVESIEISVDSKNEHEIDKLLKKILNRKKIPESAITSSERIRKIRTGGVRGSWKIDTLEFKIGLLKIAYEFAVDSIPSYFLNIDAIEISNILMNANYNKVEKYVKIRTGLQSCILQPFAEYLDLSSKKHYLVLTQTELGLVCLIKLHDLFTIGVVLTEERLLSVDEWVVGVNDIDGRIFYKMSMVDLIAKCMDQKKYTHFAYHFKNEQEASKGWSEINSPSYRFEGSENAEIPLYKENGEKYPFLTNQLLKKSHFERTKEGNNHISVFRFPPFHKYYVKSVLTGNLHQVIGFKLEQKQTKKI